MQSHLLVELQVVFLLSWRGLHGWSCLMTECTTAYDNPMDMRSYPIKIILIMRVITCVWCIAGLHRHCGCMSLLARHISSSTPKWIPTPILQSDTQSRSMGTREWGLIGKVLEESGILEWVSLGEKETGRWSRSIRAVQGNLTIAGWLVVSGSEVRMVRDGVDPNMVDGPDGIKYGNDVRRGWHRDSLACWGWRRRVPDRKWLEDGRVVRKGEVRNWSLYLGWPREFSDFGCQAMATTFGGDSPCNSIAS